MAKEKTTETFSFNKENQKKIKEILEKYPSNQKRSAVMPLLDLAQRQNDGWVSEAAMEEIARIIEMPRIKVFEVATFYTMYNFKPIGEHLLQFCGTTPCMLSGSEEIMTACQKHLGVKMGETTKDGKFTLKEVECLGGCVNAPIVQINDDYYEDLTPETMVGILKSLKKGEKPEHGSQTGRLRSCGKCGPTTLSQQAKEAGVKMADKVSEAG